MLHILALKHKLKKLMNNISIVLLCICIFFLLFTFGLSKTIFNSQLHRVLFSKYDIYSIIQSYIEKSVGVFEQNLENLYFQSNKLNDLLTSVLEKNTSPDLIRTNIDSLREGFFKYINRETELLPDIYIDSSSLDSGSSLEGINLMGKTFQPGQAPLKIEKVNLSTILHYTNRNTLWEDLWTARIINSIILAIPKLSLLLILLLIVFNIMLIRQFYTVLVWIRKIFLFSGITLLCSGFALFLLTDFYLYKFSYSLFSFTNAVNIAVPYIKSCIRPLVFFLLFYGSVFIGLSIFVPYLIRFIYTCVNKYNYKNIIKSIYRNSTNKSLNSIVNIFLICFISFLFIYYGITVLQVYKTLDSNHLPLVLSRITKTSTGVQAIPAENESIYSLNVKVVNRNTGEPVQGIFVNVSNRIHDQNLSVIDNIKETNEDGIAKFILDKDVYKVDLISLSSPNRFKLPSSTLIDIKFPGTTPVQIELEEFQEISCFYSME